MKSKTILVLLFLYSCSSTTLTGYEFKTRAKYMAKKSNIIVDIYAVGYVKKGEDIGLGVVEGQIKSTITNNFILFKIEDNFLTALNFNNSGLRIQDKNKLFKNIDNEILKQLSSSLDNNEWLELEKVILASSSGPKGTYMKGQTEFIEVDTVEFERN